LFNDGGTTNSTSDGSTTLAWLKTGGSGNTPLLQFTSPKGYVIQGQETPFQVGTSQYGAILYAQASNSQYAGLCAVSTISEGLLAGNSYGWQGYGSTQPGGNAASFWKSLYTGSSTTVGASNYDGNWRCYGVAASATAAYTGVILWPTSGNFVKSVAYLSVDDGTVNAAGLFQNCNTLGNVAYGVLSNTFLGVHYSDGQHNSGEFQFLNGTGNLVAYAYAAGNVGGALYGLFGAVANQAGGYVAYDSYSFYATAGPNGSYGPFTGSHDAFVTPGTTYTPGDIVVDVQVLAKGDVSNAVTLVALSTATQQKSVVGVVASSQIKDHIPAAMAMYIESTSTMTAGTFVLDPQYQSVVDNNDMIIINSVGEGLINVCGEGGNIEIGDYITSSSTPGKGMRQADDLMHSYTVAKSREAYTFTSTEVVQIACTYHCG
jgi:hypothetical protein